MFKYFQNKYALSEKGAKDLFNAIIWTIIMDISFMIPVIIGFKFLDEYMVLLFNPSGTSQSSIIYYVVWSVIFFIVMLVIAYFQYNSAYTKVYEESARRRVSLAETLRKLPLAFLERRIFQI